MSIYKVICRNPSTAGVYGVCFPVHENATVGQILKNYNHASQYKGVGSNFTSVTCDGMSLGLKLKMRELASVWRAFHQEGEEMIVEIVVH